MSYRLERACGCGKFARVMWWLGVVWRVVARGIVELAWGCGGWV